MAEADDNKAQEDPQVKENNESKQDGAGIGIVTWVIMAVIVVLCAGAGLLLGRLFASSSKPEATESSQTGETVHPESPEAGDSATDSRNSWYYDLEPVVANLDVPGVTRYVRATITLEISSALEQEKGEKLLEEKKPPLKDWLAIYLASLTLEDARGDRNLKRIKLQILDAFNEMLFPDARPQIKRILFNEGFTIQ